jgi:hypothetical protein
MAPFQLRAATQNWGHGWLPTRVVGPTVVGITFAWTILNPEKHCNALTVYKTTELLPSETQTGFWDLKRAQ